MQNSIIDFIFFYDDHVISKIKNSKQYDEYGIKADELYDKLENLLNNEQNKLLEELVDCEIGKSVEESECFFKAGLKIGLRLAFESIYCQ